MEKITTIFQRREKRQRRDKDLLPMFVFAKGRKVVQQPEEKVVGKFEVINEYISGSIMTATVALISNSLSR